MYTCLQCNKSFEKRHAFIGHCSVHKKPRYSINGENLLHSARNKKSVNTVKCVYCQQEFPSKGIGTHLWRKHGDGVKHNPFENYIRQGNIWNKGLTKQTDVRVENLSKSVSIAMQKLKASGKLKKYPMSEKNKQKLSIRMSTHNPGGKSKWFDVNNTKVQGTWERDFAIELNRNNIAWERAGCIEYHDSDIKKHYCPDFYLPTSDTFIEIKGHWWGDDRTKMRLVFTQHRNLRNKIIILNKRMFNKLMSDKSQFIILLYAQIAQSVERRTENPCVAGSIPALSTT